MATTVLSQRYIKLGYFPLVSKVFAEWLQEQLNLRGWSGYDLAKEMKTAPATVYRLLNGERNVGKKLAPRIALALKVDPSVVLYQAGYSDKDPQDPTQRLGPIVLDIVSMLQNRSEKTQRAARQAIELFLENFGDGRRTDEDSKASTKSKR